MIEDRPEDWHPVVFILGNVLSITLLASWFFEPTRLLWLVLDERLFWALNDTLAHDTIWTHLWAVANHRGVDLVAALCMVALFAHRALLQDRTKFDSYFAIGLMLTFLLFVGKQIADAIPISRPSPILVYPDALRLSLLVPEIQAKDFAYDVFPGDHAVVLLLCAGVFAFFLPRAHAVAAWFLVLVFSTPRLVGGGHWLTDIIVGSVAVASLVLSWTLATPLHRVRTDPLERRVGRFRQRRQNRRS